MISAADLLQAWDNAIAEDARRAAAAHWRELREDQDRDDEPADTDPGRDMPDE